MKIHIAKNIKFLRVSINLTQEELSQKIGLQSTQIGAYERGKSYPRFEGLIELGQIFQVTLDDLVYRDIEREGTQGLPASETSIGASHKELYQELLVKRIREMEREIKEHAPELANRLNID